jgi:hypothetical protein
MNKLDNVMLMLGEIKGEFVQQRKLIERVARLEMWQWYLKGAWTATTFILIWKLAH